MDKLLPTLKEKKYAMCVFYHSACFDTLYRSILSDKLERYGIRGVSLDFIKAYFANRSQYVCYGAGKYPSDAKI